MFDNVLSKKLTVLVHCAKGIHRTGIVAYTCLRMSGYS